MTGTEIEDDAKAFEDKVREVLKNQGEEITYREDLDIDEALAQLGEPTRRRKKPDPAAMTAPLGERLQSKSEQRRKTARRRAALVSGVFVHVSSRIHLQRKLLRHDKAKSILAALCHHYAKLCRIEIHHYCIMDNHLHLLLRIRAKSRDLGRMMADVKREFTKSYKAWFNDDYRPSTRYRLDKLGRGTLWDGPYHPVVIEDTGQLAAACFYIEANRLKVIARATLERLSQPPSMTLASQPGLDTPYDALLQLAREYGFQSASYYLGGCEGCDPVLTDGTDAHWATQGEVKQMWKKPARDLPEGWKRVWYDGKHAILKPTPAPARRYPSSPLWACLGNSPQTKALNFGRLLMGTCWRSRHQGETKSSSPRSSHEEIPGASEP